MTKASFTCGHPRTPENSKRSGRNGHTCRFCNRVRSMVEVAIARQDNLNRGLTYDGRIVRA